MNKEFDKEVKQLNNTHILDAYLLLCKAVDVAEVEKLMAMPDIGVAVTKLVTGISKYWTDKNYQYRSVIHFSEMLKVGDRVIMKLDKEARDWGRKSVPDGTYGTVVGFHKYIITVSRNAQSSKKSEGIYLYYDGVPYVKWDNAETEGVSSSALVFADSELHILRDKQRKENPDSLKKKDPVRIADLPKTAFFEDDEIVFYRNLLFSNVEEKIGTIDKINYNFPIDIQEMSESDIKQLVPDIRYQVSTKNGGTTYLEESEIIKVRHRGNYWKIANSEEPVFKTMADEVRFLHQRGFAEEAKNEETKFYMFSQDEAIRALTDGKADFFLEAFIHNQCSEFPKYSAENRNKISLYKFTVDTELAKQTRQLCLSLLSSL